MIARTKYKRYQFILEWVSLGLAIAWFAAGLILYYSFCDTETEILKRNLLLISFVIDIFAYLGFTSVSFLPHNNALIKTEKYLKGDKAFQYEKESRLRDFALIAKLFFILFAAFAGVSQYIF